jgi:hypothetical protein
MARNKHFSNLGIENPIFRMNPLFGHSSFGSTLYTKWELNCQLLFLIEATITLIAKVNFATMN